MLCGHHRQTVPEDGGGSILKKIVYDFQTALEQPNRLVIGVVMHGNLVRLAQRRHCIPGTVY